MPRLSPASRNAALAAALTAAGGLLMPVSGSVGAAFDPRINWRLAEPSSSTALRVRHHLQRRHRKHSLKGDRREVKPEPAGNKPEVEAPAAGAPPTGTADKAPAPASVAPVGPPPPPAWSPSELKTALDECNDRLARSHVIYDRADPIREGACGAPAPIQLKGFKSDREPDLDFSPAPIVTCKLAEALYRWFRNVVEPAAKEKLHATIVRVISLAAYQCRTRYDDPTQRISQHAFANAIDIGEFVTAKGEHISVLDQWGTEGERSAFLHEVHDGACEIFGTTLGPEANAAHRNHFHLDMKERRKPLCDFTPEQLRARRLAKEHPAIPPSAKVPVSGGGKQQETAPEAPAISESTAHSGTPDNGTRRP